MGLFSRKEKEVKPLELTQEQKDRYVMRIIHDILINTNNWKNHFTDDELAVLNDQNYAGVRVRINEFDELYKKFNDVGQKYESNNYILSFHNFSKDSLSIIFDNSSSEIITPKDFEIVYDELIKDQITKSYNQIKCMEILEDDDLDKFYDYSSHIKHNDYFNSLRVLSPETKKVIKRITDSKEIHSDFINSNNRIIKQCLQAANDHAKKLKNEEQIREQERIRKMNQEMNKAMFSSVRKVEEISQMIKESENYQDSSPSILDAKTK